MVGYLGVVFVGMLLVACAAPPGAPGGQGEAARPDSIARQEVARRQALPAAAAAPATVAGAPQPAPDFAVRTLDGRTFRLAEWRGQALVLFFMASWCVSCSFEA
ncbi:MAG: redoxin domain-containing protein, partial [Chloroflexi bacterium]|nr:redoxin domain-containing protein [Chloroflexota bacterium]